MLFKQIQFMFMLVFGLALISVTLLLIAGCSSKDNTEYKLINDFGLTCDIKGAKASKQEYENGVMVPIDGIFVLFACQTEDSKEERKRNRREIPMETLEMPYGILQSKDFGKFKVNYYRTGITERIYMTDYQIDLIKNYIRNKE